MKKIVLLNAVEMSLKFPTTFKIPTPDDIGKLKVGDYAKLGFVDEKTGVCERIWVKITEILSNGSFKATLNGWPAILRSLKNGQLVEFESENVMSVE